MFETGGGGTKTGLIFTGGLSRAPNVQVWLGVRGPPFPQKKMNLGLAEMQFPAVLRGLLVPFSLFLVNLLSCSQFTPPNPQHYFYPNLDELRDPHFQKVAPPVLTTARQQLYGEVHQSNL